MGGVEKTKILKAFHSHVCFDDQDVHLEAAAKIVPSGKVPYLTSSPLNGVNHDEKSSTQESRCTLNNSPPELTINPISGSCLPSGWRYAGQVLLRSAKGPRRCRCWETGWHRKYEGFLLRESDRRRQ